ncbi:ATP-binding cassette domain-containing protein [Leucobacter sp. VD1]|uniref:ATP-binding cassette domain-containing protein n=1 Tax=Leucobacter sp. VD1 TaxID=3080381 RepID=UPI003015A79C
MTGGAVLSPRLEVISDGTRHTVLPGTFFVVGRSGHPDLRLDTPIVSRRHLVIGYKQGWFVEDLGSSNGSYIGEERIAREAIMAPTELRLGDPRTGPLIRLVPAATPTRAPITRDMFGAALRQLDPPPLFDAQPASAEPQHQYGGAPARAPHPVGAQHLLGDPSHAAAPISVTHRPAAEALTRPVVQGEGLRIRGLGFRLANGRPLLRDISLDAPRGTLTAVVGPSGAGKSTFARTVTGLRQASEGTVSFDGITVHEDNDRAKPMIGMVPQEDVIHGQLTLIRALRFAAKLRLGDGVSPAEREARVQHALAQLDLEAHVGTRISSLSGGQRKRASVALELLTEPAFLLLDEPTSGLDPALDRQLMEEFRSLADGGRTVVTITHSVACLALCDQVVVLVPGGAPAFIGPESDALAFFGTDDWSQIFERLAADPEGCAARWAATETAQRISAPAGPSVPKKLPTAERASRATSRGAQLATLVQRQLALMVADRGYTLFLLALPLFVGLLPIVVPGETGLTQVQQAKNAQEPQMILTLLMIGAVFMGISMSIRDLVGERSIYERERAVGLSTSAYLGSKLLVFSALAFFGAAVICGVSGVIADPPTGDGVIGLGARVELGMALAATIIVGACMGLLLSALVNSQNQVMPVLIVVLMAQMVLNGGLIPLVDSAVLNAASMGVPTRWTLALGANSIDLHGLLVIADEVERAAVAGSLTEPDTMWEQGAARWWGGALVVAALAALCIAGAWSRTRSRAA